MQFLQFDKKQLNRRNKYSSKIWDLQYTDNLHNRHRLIRWRRAGTVQTRPAGPPGSGTAWPLGSKPPPPSAAYTQGRQSPTMEHTINLEGRASHCHLKWGVQGCGEAYTLSLISK